MASINPVTGSSSGGQGDISNQWGNKSRTFSQGAKRTNSQTGSATHSKVAGRVFPSKARTSPGATAATPKISSPRQSTQLAAFQSAGGGTSTKPPRATPRTTQRANSNTPSRTAPRQTKRTLPSTLPRAAARPTRGN